MPQKRCAFSDFAFRYIRRRSSCNTMGAFVISPLPRFDKRSSSLVRALPSGRVLLHAHQQYHLTRSDSLTPTLPFPAHGYRKCLLGRISPAGRRGSLQLTRCRSHHVAADTPPARTAASDSFRRPFLLSRHGSSLASKPYSFGFGRTFTDMTACPLTGHANAPPFCVGRHQLFG